MDSRVFEFFVCLREIGRQTKEVFSLKEFRCIMFRHLLELSNVL